MSGYKVTVITNGEGLNINSSALDVEIISKIGRLDANFVSRFREKLNTVFASDLSVLHGHGIWRPVNLAPLLRRRGSQTKILWSPRGMFSRWSMNHNKYRKLPFWMGVQKPAMKNVDCFHATSEAEYLDIRRLGFMQPVALVPNGVDVPLNTNKAREKQLLFLGRVHKQKGIELLIDAWESICADYPDWSLKIAGPINNSYSSSLQQDTIARNIPRLSFLGEVKGQVKTELLSNSGILVLPTYSENFGMVIAEALAHALPVVTTTETPWLDLQKDGIGWVIKPDTKELIECLSFVMSCSLGVLHEMGEKGKYWVGNNYSWDIITSDISDTYKWLHGLEKQPKCVVTE
tara:strand:- start:9810 stop:10850 length:1041 start_codon:yes stop_codon:yes gene_type:complete